MPQTIADVFNSNVFGVQSMTESVNLLPAIPGRVGSMGLFADEGITNTAVMIEERDGILYLVPSQTRGGPPIANRSAKRKARTFSTIHLPIVDNVKADDVTGIRKFGSANQTETVVEKVNDKMSEMKNSISATIEHLRVGAIKGVILDADGTTELYDLFTEFGITQTEVDFNLNTTTTDVRAVCVGVVRSIEDALGNTPMTGVHCLCGSDFFDALISHTLVKTAYERWENGAALRDDLRKGFTLGGVTFEEYRASVDTVSYIDAEEAHFFPIGVPKLFRTFYAPADYIETVNTIGLPFYAKRETAKFGKGMELEVQSNPLPMCVRPGCLIKGDLDTASASPSPSPSPSPSSSAS